MGGFLIHPHWSWIQTDSDPGWDARIQSGVEAEDGIVVRTPVGAMVGFTAGPKSDLRV